MQRELSLQRVRGAVTWRRLLAALAVLLLLWAGYLSFRLWRTERTVVQKLPPQALRVVTPEPNATEPVVTFPTSSPRPTSEALPTPYLPTAVPAAPTSTAAPPESKIADWNGKKRINVLLLGIDQRAAEPTRSDTIVLASLDFEQNRAYVLSVPRDLYVNIPGFQYWKVNAAYAIGENPKYSQQVGGGIGLMILTLRHNLGIDIDEYGILNFDGFIKAVDALGGIDINVPSKLVDRRYPDGSKYTTVIFEPGLQHMDGERALKYARIRHAAGGDFARMRRQQEVMLAVQQKARQPSILLKLPSLLTAAEQSVRTSLSFNEQMRLAQWAAALPRDRIEFYAIEGPIGSNSKGESVVFADWSKINPVLRKVFGPQAGHP